MSQSVALDAIDRSISEDWTITIPWDTEAVTELDELSSDSVRTDEALEYGGESGGEEWRVRVTWPTEAGPVFDAEAIPQLADLPEAVRDMLDAYARQGIDELARRDAASKSGEPCTMDTWYMAAVQTGNLIVSRVIEWADEHLGGAQEIYDTAALPHRLAAAEWRWHYAPTDTDDAAMGADLVATDGTVLASCLVADGELDTDSDGCGIMVDGLSADDINWPSVSDAREAATDEGAR